MNTRIFPSFFFTAVFIILISAFFSCSNDDDVLADCDIVIQNGRVIDIESGFDKKASVGIKDGRIKIISTESETDFKPSSGREVIDAGGLVVTAGFINTHTHESSGPLNQQLSLSSREFVYDGITTWIGGNCGLSPSGVEIVFGDIVISNRRDDINSMEEFFQFAESEDIYTNYAALSGNVSLRGDVGLEHGENETAAHIEAMVEILKKDMDAGSLGVSFGAFYDPGTTTESMIALAKATKERGGMAATHIREILFKPGESVMFADSLMEAINTCRESGVPLIISHLTDMSYGGSTGWALKEIEEAFKYEGLPIAADIIGYDTFSNDLFALTRFGEIDASLLMQLAEVVPSDFTIAEDVYLNGELFRKAFYNAQNMEEIDEIINGFKEGTASAGPDSESISVTAWCNIVKPEYTMEAIKKPYVFMGNDGGVSINPNTDEKVVQPRMYACFSRMLGKWSREEGAISLKEAIYKSSTAPAVWLGLDKKGRVQEGCDADIVLFDPETVIDRAVVEEGKLTGNAPGKVLRKNWTVPGDTAKVMSLYSKRFSK